MNLNKLFTVLISIFAMLIPTFKKPDSVEGIKEVKDILLAMNATALFMAMRLKDGVGFDDAAAFIPHVTSDEEFKKLIGDAYENYAKIPAEIKDVDIGEGLELLNVELAFVPKLLETLKKS